MPHGWVALVFALPTLNAQAALFQITDRKSDIQSSIPDLYAALDTLCNQVESKVNDELLSDSNRQTFLDASANANASATTLQGSDLVSMPDSFTAGLGLGGSSNGSLLNIREAAGLPNASLSVQPVALIGLSPGWLGLKSLGPFDAGRLMLNAHIGYLPISLGSIKVSAANAGVGFSYQLVRPRGNLLVGWNGIGFGFGLDYSSVSATFSRKLEASSSTTVSGQSAEIKWSSDVNVGAKVTSFLIPIDFTTGVNFLAQTLFIGLGPDIVVGSARFTGSASGPITASTGTLVSTTNLFSGTGKLDLEGDSLRGTPRAFALKFYGGYQVNLWMFKAFIYGGAKGGGNRFFGTGLRVSF